MSAFLALFRRELAAYFRTSLALVFTVIFLMLSNSFVFYLGDLYETGQASMQAYFRLLPWVCLLLVPALSMRSWSEEFRSGTIELLDALPLPPWQQVLAKFVALWCVAVGALLLSFLLWLSLTWLGDPDHGTIMLGYIGICLMLAAMLAIGLCVSSFSENQLVVYLLTAMILLLYLLAGYPLALNPVREIFPQHVVDLIGSMSFLTHLNSITRGVLDLRDVLFFAVTVVFWLAVNLLVLRERKGGMKMPASARLPLLILGLSCVYFALCQVVLVLMPPVRLDLTEKRLFTLSEGSIHILRDIRSPITLKLYYSEKEARPYPQFRQYATRVVEKVEEYAAQSDGKIKLRILDPEPYSVMEDAAIADGISAIPLEDGSGPLYFGLTALSDDRKNTIGFVKPEAEEHLEYELSKLIRSVQRIEKPKVALITELPVTGNANPAFGPATPAWVAFRQLSERYDMVTLSPSALKIPDDIDVLWVMHPRGWPADSYRQIQDFINAGRHAVILLDPNAESVPVFGNAGDLSLGSDAAAFFQPWGIVFDPDQVVLDSKYAWLMQLNENQFPKRNPGLVSLPGAAMNQSDVVTTDLDRIVLSSAGALTIRDSSILQIEPLLQSSDASRLLNAVAYRSAADDPEKLLNKFVSSQEPFVLAARFTGKSEDSKSGGGRINFIVISDTDFLSDRLWVLESNLFGEPVYSAQASNGDFFFNVIDQLSGSDDLISIRSRGMVARPFEKVDQLRRNAEQRYRDSQIGLLAELEKVQGEINSLQLEAKAGSLTADPRRTALDARKVSLRKQLRRIQRELNEDVEHLGQRIKLLNIFGLPLLLLVIAGIIGIRRRMFKDYARVGGHASP